MIALFNDAHLAPSRKKSSLEFHLFSSLPREIRLCIWSLSLKQRRFIPICGRNTKDDPNSNHDDQLQLYSSRNELGKIVSGSHYELSINAPESFIASPLFSTTRESRFAALEFYRLRLPLVQGQIRISPEYDVVFLHDRQKYNSGFGDIFADILHDIRAYDPKDEGVMHLALAGTSFAYSRFLPLYHPIAAASFVDILNTKLRSLWCLEQLLGKSRVYGPIPADLRFGAKGPPHILTTCPLVPPVSKIGRSYIGFDYIESDPRSVQEDLKFMSFMLDPRRFYRKWCALEESLGVQRTGAFSFKVCITTEMYPLEEWEEDDLEDHVSTRLGVRQVVERNHQIEAEAWPRVIKFWGSDWPDWNDSSYGRVLNKKSDDHAQSPENGTTTIGMWVFPGDAFEKENSSIQYDRCKQVFQVAETPGLVVFDI
ncbi:pectinesterase precursor protein [Rutstroemia sp. NJR-2017a BVV2]|nr:pectinesterase precursor protein [Rutstroemia sp. NJR-2017a BVV2]